MTTELRAPYPAIETITVLPNPEFGDSESLTNTVSIRRSMNGTKRTYVKRNARRRMLLDYTLSREKSLELILFVRQYHSTRLGFQDHLGREWQGYLINNPVELETVRRGNGVSNSSERVTVRLEFEGELA